MKVSFYCKNCELDQDLEGDIVNYYGGGRKFVAECVRCGKKLFRLITEKQKDPYYYQSKNVIMLRQKYRKDLIQPGEEGFRMYYKKFADQIDKAEEMYYKRKQEEKARRDKLLKKYYKGSGYRDLTLKAIELADNKLNG